MAINQGTKTRNQQFKRNFLDFEQNAYFKKIGNGCLFLNNWDKLILTNL